MNPQDMLRIATIERARWWLNVDAPLLRKIEHKGRRRLTPETVDEIATIYNVRRNLGPKERLGCVASHLNEAMKNCPNDFLQRADFCLELASSLKKQHDLRHTPYSAMTKLVWFLRPIGWTVYDSYARLGVRSGGATGDEKVRNFYEKLEREGFSQAAKQIEGILQNTEWSRLSGARVLDAFMMLKGGFSFMLCNKVARQGFIGALPGDSGTSLSRLADQIATDLADCQFIKFVG